MARKRLNKKVALIGSTVLLLVILGIVAIILRLGRDPETFIKDGDAAWLAKDYKTAQRNYLKAHNYAKSPDLKIEILFKLADMYIETDEWPKVRGCWEQIINIDTRNVEARLARFKYVYTVADIYASAGRDVGTVWKEVQSQASELVEVAEEKGLLADDRAQWEPSFGVAEEQCRRVSAQRMDLYLYLLKGRAGYELAKMGAVTVPKELLTEAIDDLEKVRRLDPNNVDACYYLALAAIERGEILASEGNLDERDRAAKQAEELLEKAVEIVSSDPKAHINLLSRKLQFARKGDRAQERQRIQVLEPEYQALVEKFPTCADVFAARSQFYSVYSVCSEPQLGLSRLDRSIESAEKAMELDPRNVSYPLSAATLHYRKFSIYGQSDEIHKAIEIAKKALSLPGVQETTGPSNYLSRISRFSLYSFLAKCYVEQLLEPSEVLTASETDLLLASAEQAVHEIEQIFGSGEEPEVVKWQGMLELARGKTAQAVMKLYAAYEQLKASKPRGRRDAQLSYTLAELFKDTYEQGAVIEFLVDALESGIELTKPQAILDYLEVLGRLDMWSHVLSPANPYNINAYEENFGPKRKSQVIRIKALIGTNQISEAEEELAKFKLDDPNTIKLNLTLTGAKIKQLKVAIEQKQAVDASGGIVFEEEQEEVGSDVSVQLMRNELDGHEERRAQLVRKLLSVEPNSVTEASIIIVCDNYVSRGRTSEAKDLVNRYLHYFPDNEAVLFYKQLLSEPEPGNVSQQRQYELKLRVISNIADPILRALNLGRFYERHNEPNKAIEQLTEALEMGTKQQAIQGGLASNQERLYRLAANHLLEIACAVENWQLAQRVVDIARRDNLDDCQGQLFEARLAVIKGEFEDALSRTNECLKQKPIFSHTYMLRSNIYSGLGNENAAIENIRKAALLNPMDSVIAKGLANTLYLRNKRLGNRVTSDQVLETKKALERAVRLNLGDLALLSAYAGYISTTEPMKALAIRQTIQRNTTSVQNSVLLGRLATRLAQQERDAKRKEVLFAIAVGSLEQAKQIEPQNEAMLESYAEYYHARGQEKEALKLLQESEGHGLLWRHHFQLGRYGQAKKTLEQLYRESSLGPRDPSLGAGEPLTEDEIRATSDVIEGLMLVAERTDDREGVMKYSEELLLLEPSEQNYFNQLRALLNVGLTKEAEHKLQSFKEKHPADPRVPAIEGWLAMRQGQLDKALEFVNYSLEIQPDNAGAWRLRGEINALRADYDQAIIDLKKSKMLSDEPSTKLSLARAYLQAERVDDAVIELKNTINDPGTPEQARLLLEWIYLKRGRKETLEKFYEDNLQRFPEDAMWHNKAAAYALGEGKLDRADQLFEKAYQLKCQEHLGDDPDTELQDAQYATALDGYLNILLLMAGRRNNIYRPEKLDKVFEVGKEFVDTAFAPIVFYRMAEAKLKLGDRDAAVDYCRTAVDKTGTNESLASEILYGMSLLLGEQEVSKYCLQRLQADPKSLVDNFVMFNLTQFKHQHNEAIDYIDKCIQIVGSDSDAGFRYRAKKARLMNIAYDETSDKSYLDGAIAVFESLLDKMPNNTHNLNNLAYLLAKKNERLPKALEYSKRAVENQPNNPNFLDTYAWVLYKNGKKAEAAEFLAASLQQYQQSAITAPAEVYMHLGVVKEELGERIQALAAYKQAMEVGKDEGLSGAVKEQISVAIERLSQ